MRMPASLKPARLMMIGAVLGLQVGYFALAGALPYLGAVGADAATGVDTSGCMSTRECHLSMDKQTLCQSKDGCCVEDRCFVPDANCPKSLTTDVQGRCYAKSPPFQLAVMLGDKQRVFDIGDYLYNLYQVAVGAALLIAAVMLTVGGFQYMTAGGDAGHVSAAKQRITDAVIGLFVVMAAYVILQTVSPDLLSLRMPRVPVVKRQYFMPCVQTEMCRPCGLQYGLSKAYVEAVSGTKAGTAGQANTQRPCDSSNIIDELTGPRAADVAATCFGKSCGCATGGKCGDSEFRCRKKASATETSSCAEPLKAIGGSKTVDEQNSANGLQGQSPYMCMQCIPEGSDQACSPNGENEKCCTGFCADGKCSGGRPGDPCCKTVAESMICNKQCQSGICQTNWGNVCSTGDVGMPCGDSDKECKEGYKCQTLSKNICVPGKNFNPCSEDKECASGYKCADLLTTIGEARALLAKLGGAVTGATLGMAGGVLGSVIGGVEGYKAGGNIDGVVTKKVCLPTGFKISIDCTNPQNPCPSDYPNCIKSGVGSQDFCTDGSLGAVCNKNENCQSNHCVDAFGNGFFPLHQRICVSGDEGGRCLKDSDCKSGHCFNTESFGICSSGAEFSPCNGQASDCASGLTCQNKRCQPSGACPAK
ncbi:MAG: pilin [Patescibacteria group bacterium]|nr:pilin [Patescibacteria group bacterium]